MSGNPNNGKIGRPSKLTPDLLDEIERHIQRGNYVQSSCGAVGISRDRFYAWLRRGEADVENGERTIYREFFERLQIAFDQAEVEILGRIERGEKNWQRLGWILERTRHSRFGQRQSFQVDIQESQPQEVIPDPPANYEGYLARRQQRILQNQARDASFTELPEGTQGKGSQKHS